MDNMNYQELQKRASELGLKYVGVSKEDLKKSIKEAEVKVLPIENTINKPNTAIVYNGTHEIRRYTLEVHGTDFTQLAQQFAGKHEGYTVDNILLGML